MRIALLTNGIFPYVIGGMQKHSVCLIRELARQGVDVVVYAIHNDKYPSEKKLLEHLTPTDATGRVSLVLCERPNLPYFPLHHYADCYVQSARMYKHFVSRQDKVDFIYAQGYMGWKFADARAKKELETPVGVNFHGCEALQDVKGGLQSMVLNKVTRGWVISVMKRADVQISLGGKLTDLIGRTVNTAPVITSYNGIDEKWLSTGEVENYSPMRFVFVGRHTKRKGLSVLYEAMDRLVEKPQKFEMHFIGDIPVEDQRAHSNFKYHGSIRDESKMRDLLRTMDILICPSFAEGMPTVILEGMASGLAIIATDVGATNELMSGNGYLLPTADAALLYDAIMDVLAVSTDELIVVKRASLDLAKSKFTWPKIVSRLRTDIGQLECVHTCN